ncbi:zinc ABC transporter permease AztB [Nocardia sp. NPDC051030]|uniref:zinc ABC transporter permease AztB n=1 Tax=Nocardia sp. NPDC051030 TaxID=3155162 RepID=UPI003416CE87
MDWLTVPLEVSFVQRALWGGLLVSCLCALAGTWIVVRGMAFLGDAMAHGMLPGVAVASLLGGNLLLGAGLSAAAMAIGVTALGRNTRFSPDIAIGLLFVGMLSLGVIIVSRSQSFAVDVTGFLFGDVLGIRDRDLLYLLIALAAAATITALGHRAFVALAFDPRKAATLGLRPRLAQAALLALVTLAIVSSFHIVGTLLVFGLLIAPPAAATYWTNRIPIMMLLAAIFGGVATVAGLSISWHAETAAGATIAAVAVGIFFASAVAAQVRDRLRQHGSGHLPRGGPPAADHGRARKFGRGPQQPARTRSNSIVPLAVLVAAAPLAGCGAQQHGETPEEVPHGFVAGATEMAEEQPRLVVADKGTGAIRVVDLTSEKVSDGGRAPGVERLFTDGRHAYAITGGMVRIVDGGSWVVDHGDHMHYYRAGVREVGVLDHTCVARERGDLRGCADVVSVHGDAGVTAVASETRTVLLDRAALDDGKVVERKAVDGIAVPYAGRLVVASPENGQVEIRDRDSRSIAGVTESCPGASGTAVTRRGVVFGCADGALVVNESEGTFTGSKIRYPQNVSVEEQAVAFTHRPGSATLVAKAGKRGVWVLDLAAKAWTFVPTGPVVAANTAGESAALLTLTRDGVLHAFDIATGTETACTQVISGAVDDAAPPAIHVDRSRAYLNDPAARAIHEIDYRDNLRRARTLPLDIAPTSFVETGL